MTDNDRQDASTEAKRRNSALVGAIVLGAALLAFVLQNTDEIKVNWLFFELDLPLWALLLVTSALAIVGAELAGWFLRRNRKRSD